MADPLQAIRFVAEGSVDPRREVLLAEGTSREPVEGFEGAVEVREDRPGLLRAETMASGPAHLVILDAYAPGWTATVDGRAASLLRANGAFRAIAVPAGRHTVECRYLPRSVVWGGGLAVLLLLATLGILLRAARAA